MKRILSVFVFLLLAATTNPLQAQIVPIQDPVEEYLRILISVQDDSRSPSFNLRPITSKGHDLEVSPFKTHPWQDHPFFHRPMIRKLTPDPVSPADIKDKRFSPFGRQKDLPTAGEQEPADKRLSGPDGRTDTLIHVVQSGETLFSLGQQYGVSVEELTEWNELDSTLLSVGQELIILRSPEPGETSDEPSFQDSTQDSPGETPRPHSENGESIPAGDPSRPSHEDPVSASDGFWSLESLKRLVTLYTPAVFTTYNTDFPLGQNDGALWQGAGLNTAFSAGVFFQYGPLEVSLRPQVIYSRNHNFSLSNWPPPEGISEFGYGFSMIDYPQRFGSEPITRLDPGQSWIRYNYKWLAAGVSTANLWTGPALHNPLIFSNNAPGFFHAFLETPRPVQTPAGNVEGKLLWGGLKESGYFDEDETNNLRFINSLILNYSPSFVPGLHLGFTRTFVKNYSEGSFALGNYFLAFKPMEDPSPAEPDGGPETENGSSGVSGRLQMISLFARWQLPDYGFEIYGEWGRNTPSENFRDFLLEPEYSRAYMLGFLKKFTLTPRRWLTFNFEMTQLESPRLIEYRKFDPWYMSSGVPQGFTHRGQVLGAGIGPGSNNQYFGFKYYDKWGLAGISFQRIVHDNDRLYRNYEVIGERPAYIINPRILNEVEFRYGVHGLVFLPYNFEFQLDLSRSRFYQYRHVHGGFDHSDGYNTHVELTLRYQLTGMLR